MRMLKLDVRDAVVVEVVSRHIEQREPFRSSTAA
jgi:hypothetical protein